MDDIERLDSAIGDLKHGLSCKLTVGGIHCRDPISFGNGERFLVAAVNKLLPELVELAVTLATAEKTERAMKEHARAEALLVKSDKK